MKLKYKPAKFTQLHLAQSFADRGHKMQMVILGDDERYWVVCMADGEKLIRAGYQVAN